MLHLQAEVGGEGYIMGQFSTEDGIHITLRKGQTKERAAHGDAVARRSRRVPTPVKA